MASEDGKQLVQWSFSNGINELERSELVDPVQGGFLTLENVRQRDVGALSKRPGYSALTATSSTMTRLFSVRDALAAAGPSGDGVKVYSETESAWNALNGMTYSADIQRVPVASTPGVVFKTADLAYCNGYVLVSWCAYDSIGTNYYVYYAIYDATTWATVVAPAVINGSGASSSAIPVKLATIGAKVYALVDHGSGNQLDMHTIDLTTSATIAAAWSATTIGTDMAAGSIYDLHYNSSQMVVGYFKTATTATAKLVAVSSTPAVTSTATHDFASSVGAGDIVTIGLGGSSAQVWVIIRETSSYNVHAYACDFSLATVGTAATITTGYPADALGCVVIGSTAHITGSDQTNTKAFHNNATISAGAIGTGVTQGYPLVHFGTRPFAYNSKLFALGYAMSGLTGANVTHFRTACVARLKEDSVVANGAYLRPVGNVAPGLCDDSSIGFQHATPFSSTKFGFLVSTVRNQASSGLEVVVCDFASSFLLQPAPVADGTCLSGGVVTSIDGVEAIEPVALNRPPKPTATDAGGTGITVSTGWRYIAVYERVDNAGNVNWSSLSDPSDALTFSNKSGATVTVKYLQFSHASAPSAVYAGSLYQIALYRTKDGGSTYYRVATKPNVPNQASTTFTDSTTDSSLGANALLYRQTSVNGAAQNRELPPALRYLVNHNDRLVGAGPDTISVWYSAKHVAGEGMWFSSLFQFPVEDGGAITGLASQFGRLVVFKRSSIFVVDGDGPSENGASGDFSLPNKLASDVGCIDARSICTCSAGVIFQSDRGVELLTPSLQVQWIGQKVQGTLRTYPVVTSAVFDAVNRYVYITCTTSDGTTGVTLVYDPVFQVWESVDKVYQNSTATAPATSACLAPVSGVPRYHRLYSGTVSRMSTSSYLDGSQWVTMKVETAWLKAAGLQGEQHVDRVLFLGQKSTDHDLTISAGYNYVSSYPQTRTWSHTQVTSNVTDLSREQLELVSSNNARCQAVRFKIEDATPTSGTVGTGRAATWLGLSVETSPRPGRAKLPTSSR